MQPAKIVNLLAEQGATFDQLLVLLGTNKLPLNLADIPTNTTPGAPAIPYGFRGQVRSTYDAAIVVITLIISTAGLSTGNINIHITANTLAAVAAGVYVWDAELFYLKDPANVNSEELVNKIAKGSFTVTPEVTKVIV